MNELIEKVENLKKSIDEIDKIKEIQELNKEIIKDKELLKLVEEYNRTQDENIKKEIVNNELFKKYKVLETDINVLILEINSKLKQINEENKDGHSSN